MMHVSAGPSRGHQNVLMHLKRQLHLCRFLHVWPELAAASSNLRHDCHLHLLIFLLGLCVAPGVLVSLRLLVLGCKAHLQA